MVVEADSISEAVRQASIRASNDHCHLFVVLQPCTTDNEWWHVTAKRRMKATSLTKMFQNEYHWLEEQAGKESD